MKYLRQDHSCGRLLLLLLLLPGLFALAAQRGNGSRNDRRFARRRHPEGASRAHDRSQKSIASSTADGAGRYEFRDVSAGRYQVRASAPSFDLTASKPFYVGEGANANVDLLLAIGVVSQAVTVTATGTPTPQAQVGASVTLLSGDDYADKLDVHEALRLVPGAQVTQTDSAADWASCSCAAATAMRTKSSLMASPPTT